MGRSLAVALPVALLMAMVCPAVGQDAASDQAQTLLKQGLEQYKALDFSAAKSTLLKVDATALNETDAQALSAHLSKVDSDIKDQAAAREAVADAEKALKDNDLAKAKTGFTTAAQSPLLTAAERKDAQAKLAEVNTRLAKSKTELKAPSELPAAPKASPAPLAVVPAKPPVKAAAATPAAVEAAPAAVGAAAVTAAPTPCPTPAAAVERPSAAGAPAGDLLTQMEAQRAVRAKELIAEGKTALDRKQGQLAVESFERALLLTPDDAQAKQLLEQAKTQAASTDVNTSTESPLERLEKSRQVMKQAALLEFDKAMKRSKEALSAANSDAEFDAAIDAARTARKEIQDNRNLFSAKEFQDRVGEADDQIKYINVQHDRWTRKSAIERTAEAERAAAQRLTAMDEQRRRKVSDLTARAKSLTAERKFPEAIDVLDQILKLDPENGYAAGAKDSLTVYSQLQDEKKYFLDMQNQLRIEQGKIREDEIPWTVEVNYPKNWKQLTKDRIEYAPEKADTTEEALNKEIRSKLKTKIPKVEFNNMEFSQVIDFLHTVSGVNIHANWLALSAVPVDQHSQVTLNLTDVTVEKALQLTLQDLSAAAADPSKLAFVVAGGVVTISTKSDLAKTPVTIVYDIRDLIFDVPDFPGPAMDITAGSGGCGGSCGSCGSSSSSGLFGNCSSSNNNADTGANRQALVGEIQNVITDTIDHDSWRPPVSNGTVGAIRELRGTLVVTQTTENHQLLTNLIGQLRETRAMQVTIEARFVSISTGFLDSIGLDLDAYFNIGSKLGGNPAPGFAIDPATGAHVPLIGTSTWGAHQPGDNDFTPIGVTTGTGQHQIGFGNMLNVSALPNGITSQVGGSPGVTASGTFLDDIQVDFLIQATQANSMSRTLTAPRLTLFNGQRAFVMVATLQAYVASLDPLISDNTAVQRPNVQTIPTGTVLDVQATVSADRRYVTLTVRPTVSVLNSMQTFPFGGNGFLQLPNVTMQQLKTTVSVPDGGTLLLGGQRLSAEVEHEGGVPILSKVPVINRLFTNRGKVRDEQTLLILIKPKIIIPKEQDEEALRN